MNKICNINYIFCLTIASIFSLYSHSAIAKDLSNQIVTRPSVLKPENVAVVYNENDKKSIEVAQYYLSARGIPSQNLISVNFPNDSNGKINENDFKFIESQIQKRLTDQMLVIVLMWQKPYAVNCNSITSALTMGYNAKQCQNGCEVGQENLYFNSNSLNPLRDHKMRLSILLPTDSIALAKSVIDRGVLSGFRLNASTAYFLKTKDNARSKPREPFYPIDHWTVQSKGLTLRTLQAEYIRDKKDVMFYFTGQVRVPFLETIQFLPGAVSDHLTSTGGVLDSDYQMQSTQWLQAGATGSYGSVSEPCNYWQKFPNPQVLLPHYLAGETLIESYWKSVKWPTQGLFIGEPLAAPFQKENTLN